MTEILAVAVGGVIALVSGFSVQIVARRERQRDLARRLVSSFLADLQLTLLEIAKNNPKTGQQGSLVAVLTAHGVASRSGAELALLSPPALRADIQGVLEDLSTLGFAGNDEADVKPIRTAYLARLKTLTSALYERFGQADPKWWEFWAK